MIFRRICDFLTFMILLFVFSNSFAVADISIRTSPQNESNKIFVAIDFKVALGEHIIAPTSKSDSSSVGISWENAEVIKELWPKAENLPEVSKNAKGYKKDFSVLYELQIKDSTKPIKYDIFYVVCSDACMPQDASGELKPNGLLLEKEIAKIKTQQHKPLNTGLLILFGFIGGLILNLMPCVFPIISLKIFSIAKISRQSAKTIRIQSFAFTCGIFTTFMILGGIFTFLKGATPKIGWGFFMQEPSFVFTLLLVFLACAIHFLGIYQFKMPSFERHKIPVKNEVITSFFSGAFSGIASASCVGPFAGVALAGAILYGDMIHSSAIFLALCSGVAFPFILIALFPKLISKFPHSGNWLNVFKNFMGYAMLTSCIWPFSILLKQLPQSNVISILIITISIAFCFWLFDFFKKKKIYKIITFCGIIALTISGYFKTIQSPEDVKIEWISYSEEAFNNAREKGLPIFLNFTATWCINCQVNQAVFKDSEVIDAFKKNGIIAIKCDWTNQDYQITNLMQNYDSVGVPLYVYYPGNNSSFEILPTFLTKQKILEVIKNEK